MDRRSINRGRQLRFAREYRRITQSDLCSNIEGLSQSNLSRFERGFNILSDTLVRDIMDYLDWPLEWLDRDYIKTNFICSQ